MTEPTPLKLAFCLFAYRPFGGLQRDFFRIAQACAARGHVIDVFTMEWQGDIPDNFNVHVLPVRRLRNHARSKRFAELVPGVTRQTGVVGAADLRVAEAAFI